MEEDGHDEGAGLGLSCFPSVWKFGYLLISQEHESLLLIDLVLFGRKHADLGINSRECRE